MRDTQTPTMKQNQRCTIDTKSSKQKEDDDERYTEFPENK